MLSVCRPHPSWVRGLKSAFNFVEKLGWLAAPFVGAWIEIIIADIILIC